MLIGKASENDFLAVAEIRELMATALEALPLDGKRVLIIIPDRTRTAPIPLMFRLFFELLNRRVKRLDYLIALGTHQPLNETAINQLIGVSAEERAGLYRGVEVFNHHWEKPETFVSLGQIPAQEIAELTDGLMHQAVDVRLNRLILDYDQLMICGPTFPHEVVGFSGGNKYFFPGIGGAEVINFSHWLGAMITSYSIIGTKSTPVRRVIDRAAALIDKPKLCFSMVVKNQGLAGLFIGSPETAYSAAADLSCRLHVRYVEKPFTRVLSVMPEMYEDLWTAAKGMYKLEPVVADGGEIIIYAPHIKEISYTHGTLIDEIGYHTRDYFQKQWDRFKHYPGGVLAHSTHLRGLGSYDAMTGIEMPRLQVTLATQISEARCRQVNLAYLNPNQIKLDEWRDREGEGILFVAKAGELLYRLQADAAPVAG
ncbi:MAG: lactate racemase domain-containing protein [Acidobacteriota bacterium]